MVDGRLLVRIVEDSAELAQWLATQLEHDMPNVRVLTSTSHFERLLSPGPWEDVDAAIVDIWLPHVSGFDILRYLADTHPTIRRVAMTASADAHQDMTLGDLSDLADECLFKPFYPVDLIRVLS